MQKTNWYRILRIIYIFSYILIFAFAIKVFFDSYLINYESLGIQILFSLMVLLGGELALYIIRKALLYVILGKDKSKEVGSWENTLKTKVNNLITKKINSKQKIVGLAILLSLGLSLYIWIDADVWVTKVALSDSWYEFPWMGRFEITYTIFVAFVKIFLINIWIFTSAFLLIKVIPDHKPEDDWEEDELYEAVKDYAVVHKQVTASNLQREFKIDYARTSRLMEKLEEERLIESRN